MRDSIFHMMNDYIENVVDKVIGADQDYDEWDLTELNVSIQGTIPMAAVTPEDVKDMNQKELKHLLKERAAKAYEAKESEFPEPEPGGEYGEFLFRPDHAAGAGRTGL